jgi:hypothetical protein
MASGHVNRTNRPNTWLHRLTLQRENFPCQLGAVHTWHKADIAIALSRCPLFGVKQTSQIRPVMSAYDPKRTLPPRRLDETDGRCAA